MSDIPFEVSWAQSIYKEIISTDDFPLQDAIKNAIPRDNWLILDNKARQYKAAIFLIALTRCPVNQEICAKVQLELERILFGVSPDSHRMAVMHNTVQDLAELLTGKIPPFGELRHFAKWGLRWLSSLGYTGEISTEWIILSTFTQGWIEFSISAAELVRENVSTWR